MKTYTKIALLFSFLSGIWVQLYINDHPYLQTPTSTTFIGVLIGGGLGLMIGYILGPLIISTIIYFINKEFPQYGFTVWTYVITALLSYILIYAHNLKH